MLFHSINNLSFKEKLLKYVILWLCIMVTVVCLYRIYRNEANSFSQIISSFNDIQMGKEIMLDNKLYFVSVLKEYNILGEIDIELKLK